MNALKLSGKTLVIVGLAAVSLVIVLLLLSTRASQPAVDAEATAQSLARLWVAQTAEAQPDTGRAGPSAGTPVPTAPTPPTAEIPAPTGTSTGAPSPVPTVTSTHAPTATRLAPTSTPSATEMPSPTLTPTLTPPCPVAVDPQLVAGWDRGKLGCPTANATIVWAAWEQFQRGYMFWRSDMNWTYVLHWQNGVNAAFGDGTTGRDAWKWDESFPEGRGLTPPPGFYEPVRGFGYVWYNFLGGPTSTAGWATEQEKGFCANLQPFEKGLVFHSSSVQYCEDEYYNWATNQDFTPLFLTIYDNGNWERR